MRIIPAPLGEKNTYGNECFPKDIVIEQFKNQINKIGNTESLMYTMDEPDSTTILLAQKSTMSSLIGLLNQPPIKSYPHDMVENVPLNLSLPQKDIVHPRKSLNNPPGPQPPISVDPPLQAQHNRISNPLIPVDSGLKHTNIPKTDGEKSRIVFEACLPDSSCYNTAKRYNIPHQYIFKWCQHLFGITIREMKNKLKSVGENLPSIDKAIKRKHPTLTNALKIKKRFFVQEKKQILYEICVSKLSVIEYCKQFKLAPSNIYRWSISLYQMKFAQLRQQALFRLRGTIDNA